MSANNITIGLNVVGQQQAAQAASTLAALRSQVQGLQQLSQNGGGILPSLTNPIDGIGGGRTDYERHNREITDQAKQIQDLMGTYEEYEQRVFSVGRAYGYARDQMVQMFDQAKILRDQQRRESLVTDSAAYGRLTGLDPTMIAGSMTGFARQGVTSNSADQGYFMAALEQAVTRGSQGGFNVLAGELIPLVQSITAESNNRNPFGYGLAGAQSSMNVLSAFSASGIPGLQGEGGARLYNQINGTLVNSQDGMSGLLSYGAYNRAHPGGDIWDYEYDRQQGLQDPKMLQALMQESDDAFGAKGSKAKYVQAGQALGLTPQQYEALERSMKNEDGSYRSLDPTDYSAVLKRIGARPDMDAGALGLLGRVEGTSDQKGVDQVIGDYEKLSGTTYRGKRDKDSFERFLGQKADPMMGSFADQNEAAKNDAKANYEDAARAIRDFILAMNKANDALSYAAKQFTNMNPNAVGFGGMAASVGGPILGGIAGGLSQGLSLYALARGTGLIGGGGGGGLGSLIGGLLGGGGGAAGGAATLTGGGLITAGLPGVGTAAGGAAAAIPAFAGAPVAGAAGGAIPMFGGGASAGGAMAGTAALPFALFIAATAATLYGGKKGYDHIVGSNAGDFDQRAEAEKEAKYQKYMQDTKGGTDRGFLGVGNLGYAFTPANEMADWQQRAARDRAGNATTSRAGSIPTAASAGDEMMTLERQEVDLLIKIESHLADRTNFDRRAQEAYGAGTITGTGSTALVTAAAKAGAAIPTGATTYAAGSGGTYGNHEQYRSMIEAAAKEFNIPADALAALLKIETPNGDANAVSGAGARGLGQIMPETWDGLVKQGVVSKDDDPFDPKASIRGAAAYYAEQYKTFGNGANAAAAYQGGPGAIVNGKPRNDIDDGNLTPEEYAALWQKYYDQINGGKTGGGTDPRSKLSTATTANYMRLGLGDGGGATGQNVSVSGKVEVIVKSPNGAVMDRQWADLTADGPFGGIINWPTRGEGF